MSQVARQDRGSPDLVPPPISEIGSTRDIRRIIPRLPAPRNFEVSERNLGLFRAFAKIARSGTGPARHYPKWSYVKSQPMRDQSRHRAPREQYLQLGMSVIQFTRHSLRERCRSPCHCSSKFLQ
jgi:hypothetical protein